MFRFLPICGGVRLAAACGRLFGAEWFRKSLFLLSKPASVGGGIGE